MNRPFAKNFDTPDESITLGGVVEDIVEIAGFTVGRSVQPPGWRWSKDDPRAKDQGVWCSAHHVGVVLSGRWGAELPERHPPRVGTVRCVRLPSRP